MKWDRWELGEKAIFYDEIIDKTTVSPCPAHVETLRSSMLDFSCAILDYKEGPDGFEPDPTAPPRRSQEPDPALIAARKAFNKATSMRQQGFSEKSWEQFFQSHFFEPLASSVSVSAEDSRR